jgi:hypothetical protein
MTPADSFTWRFDWQPPLPPDYALRVLQRDIANLSELEEDLLPFRSVSGQWRHMNAERSQTVSGLLVNHATSPSAETYIVREDTGILHQLELGTARRRSLTVWRVAEQLDLLQLRLFGTRAELHIQAGGGLALPVLATLKAAMPQDPVARNVLHLFRTGETPNNLDR